MVDSPDFAELHATYLAGLPVDPTERAAYLVKNLDTQDPIILQDAYGQLINTPASQIAKIKSNLSREKLRQCWPIRSLKLAEAIPEITWILWECTRFWLPDEPHRSKRKEGTFAADRFGAALEGYLVMVGDAGLPLVEMSCQGITNSRVPQSRPCSTLGEGMIN